MPSVTYSLSVLVMLVFTVQKCVPVVCINVDVGLFVLMIMLIVIRMLRVIL